MALEALSLQELMQLESRLDVSTRKVRDLVMAKSIAEVQLRQAVAVTEQQLCSVCMERGREVVFQCGHQSCELCSNKLVVCPYCRVPISAKIKLFAV